MKAIKYYDFNEISNFFYRIILDNCDAFEGIVKQKNIVQKQDYSSEANISVLTNWIPTEELNEYISGFEDFWNKNILGFGCLIQASAGQELNSQEAFNITTSIVQRLKVLLEDYENGFSINNEKMKMTIYNIDFMSITNPDNPTSDFALSICRIVGIWKFYE